jgi:hypothetical protein
MIDPENDNTGEFIEVYNASDSIIDLTQYYMCDEQDTDAIVASPDHFLSPGEYGLILDADYAGEYDDRIPDSIARFTIEDARFGMYGISNSTEKCFSLLSNDRSALDSYLTGHPEWPAAGYSIERIRFDDHEWLASRTPSGTPGYMNSVAPKDLDLSIGDLRQEVVNHRVRISFYVKNVGLCKIDSLIFGYIMDIPKSDNLLKDTLTFMSTKSISPMDSITLDISFETPYKGCFPMQVFAVLNNSSGDTMSVNVFDPFDKNDLIITEFVARTGDNFSSEYIELQSRSALPLAMKGIGICDLTGCVYIDSNYVLSPDSIFVLAQSTSFHDDFPFVDNYIVLSDWRNLNNGEDLIQIQNPDESIISSLYYDSDWYLQNDAALQLADTSLDYRDPNNWEITFDGSPGKRNTPVKQLRHLTVLMSKNFFTPRDSLNFHLINDGYFPVEDFSASFVTPASQRLLNIPSSDPGDTFSIRIDTTDMFSQGTQTCTLDCTPYASEIIKYYAPYGSSPCFLNEIMFDPVDTYGQAEFIEIFSSQRPLDLDHWSIKVNNSVLELRDTLLNMYSCISDPSDRPGNSCLTYHGFPTLPNAGADVFLLDPMDRIMDHADLRDHPKIKEGKSLEKQFQGVKSNDRDLWFSSVSDKGMTPGRMNSVSAMPGCRTSLGIYPECFDPKHDDLIQFAIDSEDAIEYCEIFCFNLAGQCLYRHEQNAFSNASFLHFWNGKMQNGEYPARGIYLVVAILYKLNGQVLKLKQSFIVR